MKKSFLILSVIMSTGMVLAGCEFPEKGKWLSGDFHQHTLYTDGSNTFDFVMVKNAEFGLDFWANSEHGGERNRDGNGNNWDDTSVYPDNPFLGWYELSGGHQEMWRWQSIRDYVWPDILKTRELYPEKIVFSGFEWNVPGHEHCSVSVTARDADAISAFEYMFDASDEDMSREGEATEFGELIKRNGYTNFVQDNTDVDSDAKSPEEMHQDSVAAAAWMQSMYKKGLIDNAWIVYAHPERKGPWDPENGNWGYNVENYRDYNNAAPDICFGFEGAPGHQTSGGRGGFGDTAFGGTYGGTGFYTAKVGGLWDALLGEGRHWFNFASSDYHRHHTAGGGDFYPGEYQKTWAYTVDENDNGEYDLNEVANALRSGNVYHVMGDLIDYLDFSAKSGKTEAVMGEDMYIGKKSKRGKKGNSDFILTVKFSSPSVNNNGDTPVVDHVDIIAGEISGKISPESADYKKATNDSTKVIATYALSDCKKDRDGNYVIKHKIKRMKKNMYFRLRGTNIAPNTLYETDEEGNPLADSLATEYLGLNGAEEAWADLWFYSNPIFVYVK